MTLPLSTDRYIPERMSEGIANLRMADNGALMVGRDGVLRSFARNGTVIHYLSLDWIVTASHAYVAPMEGMINATRGCGSYSILSCLAK